ncbi:zinc finger protein, partial [Oryctes borbonicus]
FCHRQSLITHSTLHTGIKPYSCENCGHSFSCVGNLLKHRKTHIECGLIISTSHRVTNPFTKMKVKVNTPTTVKLRAIEKQKEMKNRMETSQSLPENEKSPNNKNKVSNGQMNRPLKQFGMNASVQQEVSDVCDSNNFHNTKDSFIEKEETEAAINIEKENVSHKSTPKQHSEGEAQLQKISKCRDDIREHDDENRPLERETECCSITNVDCNKNTKKNSIAPQSKVFECSCCQERFHNKSDCEIHQLHRHSYLLTCQECDKVFSNPDLLRFHKSTFHSGTTKKTYTYICDRCGKQFKQKSALIRHNQNKCTDGPQIKCTICDKNFSSVYVRKYHMRVHNAEKKLFCKFCGKSFHWKGQLKIHERRHTGEKPFTCLYCPKAFAYRESLITHSSLHTGIKPHLCEACGSRFSCIGNLIKHKGTHANTCGAWYSKINSNSL